MTPDKLFVIGVDYGTDSVRSVILNASNGDEISSSVFYYPRWKDGLYCDANKNQFRQHPLDYIEGLEVTIKDCLQKAGNEVAKSIKAISVDTTGSSPVAVDKHGTPLALLPKFESNPNAMFVLWKDHTSTKEAFEFNEHANKFGINYLQYVGGIYSSEWFWSKLLHILRVDDTVRSACYSWVEHCDWIPFLLTGGTDVLKMKRGVCSAGHKALWAEDYGEPSMGRRGNCWDNAVAESFFSSLKKERIRKRIYRSRDIARSDISDYIESFYNQTRRHSYLGGVSPDDFELVAKRGQKSVH